VATSFRESGGSGAGGSGGGVDLGGPVVGEGGKTSGSDFFPSVVRFKLGEMDGVAWGERGRIGTAPGGIS
jgi:hypothetical protein